MSDAKPIATSTVSVQSTSVALVSRIRQLIERGHFNAAALLLPTLDKRGTDPGIVLTLSACISIAQGDRDEARRIVSAGLAEHPEDPTLLCFKAELNLAESNWVEAAKSAADAIIAAPENAVAKSMLGRALLALGKGEQAGACLLEALDKMPRDLVTLRALSQIAPGEVEAALGTLLAAECADTSDDMDDNIELEHLLISLMIARGDCAAATDRIKDIVRDGKATLDTGLLAVQAAINTGDWSEATSLFNTTTSHLPRHA